MQLKEIKDWNQLLVTFIKVLHGQDIYKSIEEKAIENIEKQRIYKQFERISETNGTIQKQSKQGIQLRKRLYIKIGIMRYKMTDRAG